MSSLPVYKLFCYYILFSRSFLIVEHPLLYESYKTSIKTLNAAHNQSNHECLSEVNHNIQSNVTKIYRIPTIYTQFVHCTPERRVTK